MKTTEQAMAISERNQAEDPRVICVIRDLTNQVNAVAPKHVNLPASYTFQQLLDHVCKEFSYLQDSFLLKYEKGHSQEVVINQHKTKKLSELLTIGKKNTFTIHELEDGVLPLSSTETDSAGVIQFDELKLNSNDTSIGLGVQEMTNLTGTSYDTGNYHYNKSYISQSPVTPFYNNQQTVAKIQPGLCGLVNQAMTCYLNSLLQTLYMTPEFRNALYKWQLGDTEQKQLNRCIPYQLQRLYLQMQTGKRRAVETTDITRSFGWDSSEAWQQHDVQELCRVMFDALEHEWRDTDQKHLINELYQGKLKDYVKCLECKNESARVDAYLDIPLVIKPFGATQAYKSVQEALRAFMEPEILDGNNQYQCEKCNRKCDAHKGLKFISFPYLLTLQLKRFDFDYNTMHRIKLNDRMTFPEILDLNDFIDDDKMPPTPGANGDVGFNSFAQFDDDDDDAFEPDEEQLLAGEERTNEYTAQLIKEKGENVYELFSIMIHSGSAMGGHYYAYIKSFADKQWYSFNDQLVERITKEDIRKTFGGAASNRGFYSATYASSTNAYMLMYRKVDPNKNADLMDMTDFPDHIRELITDMQSESEASIRQKEKERSMCKVKTYCHHPLDEKLHHRVLEVNKDASLAEATDEAFNLFNLKGFVPRRCVRLVKYDDFNNTIDRSYEEDEERTIGSILGGVKPAYGFELMLERKRESDEWEHYKPGGYTLKIHLVNLDERQVNPEPVNVRCYFDMTVSQFKNALSRKIKKPADHMRCVLEKYGADKVFLEPDAATLKMFDSCHRGNKIYVDTEPSSDVDVEFVNSQLYQVIDSYQNTVKLLITMPTAQEITRFKDKEARREPYNESADIQEDETVFGDFAQVNSQSLSPITPMDDWDEADSTNQTVLPNNDKQPLFNDEPIIEADTNSQPIIKTDAKSQPIIDNVNELNQENLNKHAADISEADATPTIPPPPPLPASKKAAEEEKSGEYVLSSPYLKVNNTREDNFSEEDMVPPVFEELEGESTDKYRVFNVWLDKRIKVSRLKELLQPKLDVPLNCFKLYRVYANNQEFESNIHDTLANMSDDSKMTIKLGRVPRKGEYKLKLYELVLNAPPTEAPKPLPDVIVSKGMTIAKVRETVSKELYAECGRTIQPDRIRLRKKSWKNPGTIYTVEQRIEDDIMIYNYSELFLQVLDAPDVHRGRDHDISIFIQQWKPSAYEFSDMSEIILSRSSDIKDLKHRLSEDSAIPAERVEIAKGKGAYPGDMSVLEAQAELEWNPPASSLTSWPLCIIDDGCIVIYRDRDEKLGTLTSERRKEICLKEAASNSKTTHWNSTYTPKKEKALKIYTDGSSSSSPAATSMKVDRDLD